MVLRYGNPPSGGGMGFCCGDTLSGDGNPRRSDFDNSNLSQS